MFQKCSFCPTLQIRDLLERSHSSHRTTVRAINERLIRHAQGSPSGSLSPGAIGLCRTFRNSTPLFITTVSTYKGLGVRAGAHMQDRTLRAARALAPSPCVPLPRGRGSCPSLDRDLRAVRALAPSPCLSLPARPAQEGEGNNGQPFFNFSYFFSSNLAIRPRCTSSGPSAMRSTRA